MATTPPPYVMEEEKKSQEGDSEAQSQSAASFSTKSDAPEAESVDWRENPKNAYFRDMFTEGGNATETDDDNTLAQIYRGRDARSVAEDSYGYSEKGDPNAPLRMAIVGPEDDLSTIAGDTVAGQSILTEGAVLSSANLTGVRRSPQPVTRDFSEYNDGVYKTPSPKNKNKKSRWNPYGNLQDDDERTQPETPPGMTIGVPHGTTDHSKDDFKEENSSTNYTYISPSKKVFLCAALIGVILILAIAGLAIAYVQISDKQKSTSAASTGNNPAAGSATGEDFEYGGFTPEDFASNVVGGDSSDPVEAPVAPLPEGTPTAAPVVPPTAAPVPVPADVELSLLELLLSKGVNTDKSLADPDGPQAQALRWLASDPEVGDYTESRLVQRWVLGILGFAWSTDAEGIATAGAVLEGWLGYGTNECDWFSTHSDSPFVCNGFGLYESLELQDQGLYGNIPTEIGLLSSALRFVDLRGNNFSGKVPKEIGALTSLERLHLTDNNLDGKIPKEIGNLVGVQVLGLGRNEMEGEVPKELGNLVELSTLGLEANNFWGEIPDELGNLESMKFLVLNDNAFSGTVPFFLENMPELEVLKLGNTLLTGEVPEEVCEADLSDLEADCHRVECECCTFCTSTPGPTSPPQTDEPTESPTPSPTIEPTVATPAPTSEPTPTPTPAPTECSPDIRFDLDNCVESGEELVVEFQNCEPEFGDWVGIYDKNADPTDLPPPFLWVWACGSQSCRGSPTSNTVVLNADVIDEQSGLWPLPKGDYYAYLIRNSGTPYQAFVSSDKQKLKDEGKC